MRLAFSLCLLMLAAPAAAQVTTNDQALEALKPAQPAPSARPPSPALAPRAAPKRPIRRATRPAPTAKAPPAVPATPPANPVIAPPTFVMPTHPHPKPPPVSLKTDAAGIAAPIAGGTRVTFGTGSSDLNQATFDAIAAYAARAKTNPALMITVNAWAPGSPDDPSTPRSLALERALAARTVLINAGVPSERIFANARGMDGIGAGPPDRLDITIGVPKSAPAGSPVPPAPASRAAGK